MSLYKRGRIWWCEFTGKGFQTLKESTSTADRTAAQEYHDRRAAELWRIRRLGQRPRAAFADAAADWLEGHSKGKKSHADDRLLLATLLELQIDGAPALPDWLDELTTTRMTAVRGALRTERKLAPATCNHYLGVLAGIWRHAHERELVDAFPAIPTFKRQQKRSGARWTVLTPEQVGGLFAQLPEHLLAIARFAMATGLRDANVRGLKWENVDLGQRIARVWPDQAKGGALIAVPLNDAAVAVLRACLGQHPTHVFTYPKVGKGGLVLWRRPIGKRSNNTAWRAARDRAGLPGLRFHDLRHTWATWHAQAGTPELVLQKLGGWQDLRMVSAYAHLVASGLHEHAGAIKLPEPTYNFPHSGKSVEAVTDAEKAELVGVDDGIRTRNNRNHNTVARIGASKNQRARRTKAA